MNEAVSLKCRKCKAVKPLDQFLPVRYVNKTGVTKTRQCAACKADYDRAYREKTRETRLEYMNAYYYANIDKYKQRHQDNKAENNRRARENTMRRKFRMTYADRDAMLAAQGGVCAICGTSDPGPKDWHIDHCHASDRVRGILCHYCNVGLGHMRDSPVILQAAADYLGKHK